jgi:hypothetical protein
MHFYHFIHDVRKNVRQNINKAVGELEIPWHFPDIPNETIIFPDFQDLEKDKSKFPDFPGFPWWVRTLILLNPELA